MKLVIAGGGTGGHLFPGIAVAEEFLSRDKSNEVLFVGTERGIESRAVPAAGYRLEVISAAGIRGKGMLSQLKGAAMMLYGYAQSRKILKDFSPDMVLGVGGYASLPIVLASRGMQIPRFIHEQNAIPGQTNRLLAKFANQVFITLEESGSYFPKDSTLLTGNPLRRQILNSIATGDSCAIESKKNEADLSTQITQQSFNLLVFGGSQGAHAINSAMIAALPLLKDCGLNLNITHQTGDKDLAEVCAAYRAAEVQADVTAFISGMAEEYAKADLVICRAGATTIAETTACGKACLFIPFPHAVDDHQRKNAEALLKKDACFMMLERELTGISLAESIQTLAQDRILVRNTGDLAFSLAKLDAARIIVDEMLKKMN
ncbi:MAG: undecaprenyldiphospho-muramoylpentapeptide beta-N-acetylglucosaminyltransferase [Desulfuromonadaceae bacterium]|nr:undecaprenyldiphospho-muramoylpentapeptide beta-N-acetylglucosaminyltransferase [Desulfuromonadaceae bacterium]MDD2855834.1 undecaprenyldiphospho-muramoylpentapeptide beta-N-acetylglucosaminyltransferase [Desulfuromonadaceae bacterium]